jgi:uncharacterized RDD family membrane protein YckC
MSCPHCGQPVEATATFCGSCGNPLVEGVSREIPGYHHGYELAGFWPRLGALLIDGTLLGLIAGGFALIGIALATTITPADGAGSPAAAVISILGFTAALVIPGGLAWRFQARGTSPGARAAHTRVLDEHGNPPGVRRGLGRLLVATFLSNQIFYIGYLWAIWDREHRTWHDHLAGTWVVRHE